MDDDVGAVAHGFTVLIVRRRRIILGKTAKKNRRIGARPIPGLRIQTRGTRALCLVEFPKIRATRRSSLKAESPEPMSSTVTEASSIRVSASAQMPLVRLIEQSRRLLRNGSPKRSSGFLFCLVCRLLGSTAALNSEKQPRILHCVQDDSAVGRGGGSGREACLDCRQFGS